MSPLLSRNNHRNDLAVTHQTDRRPVRGPYDGEVLRSRLLDAAALGGHILGKRRWSAILFHELPINFFNRTPCSEGRTVPLRLHGVRDRKVEPNHAIRLLENGVASGVRMLPG